uniref:alpha amylase N-terminal ig-like domain-containing protein n=1 Tax=Streptococcus pneumoniae TaxID=1313 RepID=UPI0015D82C55
MFFTSHLKRYINRYEKATFFALKTSHTNNLRVTSLAGNSYPYYQDTKKMAKITSDAIFDYWQVEVSVDFARIQYLFELK